jgi:hypothetical protein
MATKKKPDTVLSLDIGPKGVTRAVLSAVTPTQERRAIQAYEAVKPLFPAIDAAIQTKNQRNAS